MPDTRKDRRITLCVQCNQPMHPEADTCLWCRTKERIHVERWAYRALVGGSYFRRLVSLLVISLAVNHRFGVGAGVAVGVTTAVMLWLFEPPLPWR